MNEESVGVGYNLCFMDIGSVKFEFEFPILSLVSQKELTHYFYDLY